MLKYMRYSHSTPKHRFNVYKCSHCGTEKAMRQRDPQHDSCGCKAGHHKHGHERGCRKTAELTTYRHMLERCYSPACKDYPNYGGRGIAVCGRWLESFDNFLADMGPRPSLKHSIDRVLVNGNYSPENCRWATKLTQARNTRANRFITLDGQTLTVSEWLTIKPVSKTEFYRRLKRGMTPQEALS